MLSLPTFQSPYLYWRCSIIFVHGLTGNRESTWTHKNGTFWPELLAAAIPRASVMTYGYDADITKFWGRRGNMTHHGKLLADAIVSCRTKQHERPIMFVAHSLGGLVVEQALIRCRGANPNLQSVLRSTIGIIFMGTPHSGPSLSRWGRIIAQYLNFTRQADASVINALQPESSLIENVQKDFGQLLQFSKTNMHIFCFYESSPIRGVGEIVSKGEAIIREHGNASIAADHRDMTKFSGPKDTAFDLAVRLMRSWIGETLEGEHEGIEAQAGQQTEEKEMTVKDGEDPARGSVVQTINHTYGNVSSKGGHVFNGGQTFSGGQNFNAGPLSS
jgi:protein SERAC1